MLSPYEVWRLWLKGYSGYWAETDFTLRVTVTLTFDLLTPKSIGVFYSIRAITLWSLKALGQRVLELLSGNEVWQTDRRTDGQTDRRTRQKQYVSPRGGRHNNLMQLTLKFAFYEVRIIFVNKHTYYTHMLTLLKNSSHSVLKVNLVCLIETTPSFFLQTNPHTCLTLYYTCFETK